jgi:hypothetical protein
MADNGRHVDVDTDLGEGTRHLASLRRRDCMWTALPTPTSLLTLIAQLIPHSIVLLPPAAGSVKLTSSVL